MTSLDRPLRPILLCVILPALLLSVQPSLAFKVPFERKASLNQAAASPLFINMVKARNKAPTSRTILPLSSAVPDEVPKEQVTWKDRLLKVSNIASILCVIDCTVLPIVTIVMPLLGLAAFTPAQMEWLHHFGKKNKTCWLILISKELPTCANTTSFYYALGHQVAMYFVIPVGGTAAALNYSSHKQWKVSLPALFGLLLIYAANGHGGPFLGLLPHELAHALHHGAIWHRATNVAGCAVLLTSNYKSHQATHAHGECCNHNH